MDNETTTPGRCLLLTTSGASNPETHTASDPGTVKIKHFLVVLLMLLTAACSRTELLYDNADWLINRWVGDLLDASGAQDDRWRELMREALAAHRRDLLPETLSLLRALEDSVSSGEVSRDLSCLRDAVDRIYRRHAEWAAQPAALVMLDISPQQINHLAEQMQERNREYRDDYLAADPQRRARERVDRYVERIERWTGDLSTDQLRRIEQEITAIPDVAEDWLLYREQKQHELLTLLRAGADRSALQRLLVNWWANFAGRPAAMIARGDRAREGTVAMVIDLYEQLDAPQRAKLVEKIAAIRRGLEQAQGDEAPTQAVEPPMLLACRQGLQAGK